MKKKLNLEWFYAAIMRAIKTIAQTAVGMIAVGAAINEIAWQYVISVALVAGLLSILTSVATNLPEVGCSGTLEIDTSGTFKDIYRLNLDTDIDDVRSQNIIKLKVDPNAILPKQRE